MPRNISSISMLHFPRHHNKKGTDFSIPFFALADFFTNSIFFRSKATISERSVTDNNPIRCVATLLWVRAVSLNGLRCFTLNQTLSEYLKLFFTYLRIFPINQNTFDISVNKFLIRYYFITTQS